MILGSHNSWSYLPLTKWWMKPFAWMARCQKKNVWLQKDDYNVKLFDLRVRFDSETGLPVVCHGLMEFETPNSIIDEFLKILGKNHYVRVVLEMNKHDEFQEFKFKEFCKNLQSNYSDVHFFGGNNRTDWGCKNPIYDFHTPLEDMDDKYSSVTTLFPNGPKWLKWVDDLCPVLYAKLHNKENIEKGTNHKWLFIDFVNIQ